MKFSCVYVRLMQNGFKFLFYANEHEPKHIHVMKGGDFAKVKLADLFLKRYGVALSDQIYSFKHPEKKNFLSD